MRLCYVAFHKTRASCSSFSNYIRLSWDCPKRTSGNWRGGGYEISDVLGQGRGWFVKIRASENCLKNQIFKFSPSSLVKTKSYNKSRFHINITFEYLLKCSTADRVGDFLHPDNLPRTFDPRL